MSFSRPLSARCAWFASVQCTITQLELFLVLSMLVLLLVRVCVWNLETTNREMTWIDRLINLNRIMAAIWHYFYAPPGMALSSVFNTFQVEKFGTQVTVEIMWSCNPENQIVSVPIHFLEQMNIASWNSVCLFCARWRIQNSSEQIRLRWYDDFCQVKSKEYGFSNSAKNSDSEFGEL